MPNSDSSRNSLPLAHRGCANVVLAGGGTGGHLFPGIAVAESLVANSQAPLRVVFFCSDRPVDARVLKSSGCEFRSLPIGTRLSWRKRPLRSLFALIRAYRAARRWLAVEQPSVVVGLGGFASVPTVFAAARCKLPIVLLEQNAIAGKATRLLARFADIICISIPDAIEGSLSHLRDRIVVTGNPIRKQIPIVKSNPKDRAKPDSQTPDLDHRESTSRWTLLVLGGSQGAHWINEAMCEFASKHNSELGGWQVVHQTGATDQPRVSRAYQNSGITNQTADFFEDIDTHYASADLVVTRGGGTTLAELASVGLPMLIVPYPFAAENHQHANAPLLCRGGSRRGCCDDGGTICRRAATIL